MGDKADLGLLFVHGIGEQQPGETLIRCADPIFEFVKPWLGHRGHEPSFDFEYGTLKADGRVPPHAMAVLATGQPEQKYQILVAEAYWADSFVVPPSPEFRRWSLQILPYAIGRHYGQRIARAWRAGGLLNRIEAIWTLVQLEVAWLTAPIPIAVMLVLQVVWLIPIDSLRSALERLRLKMTATLGDSFALLFSGLNEVSIKTRVLAALDWLAERSNQVVIVAHSQGAAIAAFTLSENPRDNVKRLITYGSGVRKLYETAVVHDAAGLWRSCWFAWIAVYLIILAAWGLVEFAIHPATATWKGVGSAFLFLVIGVLAHLAGLINSFDKHAGPVRAKALAAKLHGDSVTWTEFYSSHDPVSNGRLLTEDQPGLEQVEVANERSILRDHNIYWQNTDQFVPALAARAFDGLPGPLGDIGKESKWLNEISLRRHSLADSVTITRLYLAIAAALTWWYSSAKFKSSGNWFIGVMHWAHFNLRQSLGPDFLDPLPERSRDFPEAIGYGLAAAGFWALYRACMAWWRSLVRGNRETLLEQRIEKSKTEESMSVSVALPVTVLLFALIANVPDLNDWAGRGIYMAAIIVTVFWLVGNDRRRRNPGAKKAD